MQSLYEHDSIEIKITFFLSGLGNVLRPSRSVQAFARPESNVGSLITFLPRSGDEVEKNSRSSALIFFPALNGTHQRFIERLEVF